MDNNEKILHFLIESGKVDIDHLKKEIEMNERKNLLKKHKYRVWQGKNGYWYTYIDTFGKKKVLKKLKNKSDIEDCIIEFLKNQEKDFYSYFKKWVNRKKLCGVSNNTIYRYYTDYTRFFEGEEIEGKKIYNITDEDILFLINKKINELQLSYKALKSMFYLIRGVLTKAMMDKEITQNPCDYVDIEMFQRRCFKKEIIDTDRVLSNQEIEKTFLMIHNCQTDKPDYAPPYAIELALYTGMRIGELAGLKWDCVDFENEFIVVKRAEVRNRPNNDYVLSSTKTGKIRYIPMTKEIKSLLERIKSMQETYHLPSEFVFYGSTGQSHTPAIATYMQKVARHCCDKVKGIHAIRRTLNSIMRCNGVSATVASSLLGHSEMVNRNNYTYNVFDAKEKMEVLSMANQKIQKNS